MKRVTSYRLVKAAFYVAVVASILLLTPATMNYLEFYVALSHVYLKVDSVGIYNVSSDTTSGAFVGASLSLVHNSSYVGLKIFSVDITVYYDENSEVLFDKRFWLGDSKIDPFSTLVLTIRNETSVYDFARFVEYNDRAKARGDPVILDFSPCVNLYLLGNSVAERIYLDDVAYTMPHYVG